jgi:hypothetical protein
MATPTGVDGDGFAPRDGSVAERGVYGRAAFF